MKPPRDAPALPSVLSSWTRAIADALTEMGADTDAVLASAGLSREALRDPNARLPATASARLFRAAAAHTGDPAFGLTASKSIRQTTFHALGYAIYASATLREALHRLVRYGNIVSDAAELALETTEATARLSWVHAGDSREVLSAEAIDAVMSLIVRTCRNLTDRSFTLLLVEQRRPRPADVAPYETFFRCPVRFGAEQDALTCDAAFLDRPLPSSNPALALHNDDLVRRYLADMRQGTVPDRVRAVLSEHVSTEPSPAAVAAQLGMSLRSMQRRLGEQGVSYASLLQETRRELACAYLLEERHSVTEIAFRLGFDDASAFARAFRRWTGLSPSEYRARASGPSGAK